MKEKNHEKNDDCKLKNKELVLEETSTRDLYETDNGYRLDRLKDEEEFIFEKLSDTLSDKERYWFYRYRCTMMDMMELKLKM
jgi:hypothetical protein